MERTLPILALLPALLLPSCNLGRPQPDLPVEDGVIAAYPFAPATLRIHPLTHVEPGWERAGAPADRSQLILHFELIDRYGDSVKGLGNVHVELYRPGPGDQTQNLETQELAWDIEGMDLPEANTRRFDMATRTYRVPLVAPVWLSEQLAAGGWVKVRVTMRTPGPQGERLLEDEYVIQG